MPFAANVLHGHGQDRAHIAGDSGFGDAKGTCQLRPDAVAEALSPEVLGDLLSAQTGFQAADAVIFTPPIRALTDLGPTGICTPDVRHLSFRFCVSATLTRDS